ncbi:MAG: FG-GAP-like repeat-containing protein [Myxococcales bacterium]
MVKQSRVTGSGSPSSASSAAVLKATTEVRVSSRGSRWKAAGRASGVFAVGMLAALSAPREAKALGYFTDNTTTTLPLVQPCADTTKVGCYTSWLTTADLDGDGDLDIIEANGGGYYSTGNRDESTVYLNDGKGVFTDVTPTTFGAASNRLRQVTVADIDGDGDLDLYQPGGFGFDLDKLWVQTAPGVFVDKAATQLPAGLMSHAASAHMGDLDGDGDMDLIVMDWGTGTTTSTSRAIMYTNDGNGTFSLAAVQNDDTFYQPTDRLPATIIPTGSQLPSTGGNTQTPVARPYYGVRPIDVDFADVDNDFDIDILVNHRNGYSRIFLNDGHGNFTDGTNFQAVTANDPVSGLPVQTITTNYPSKRGPYVYNQEVCDIDDDGDLDLLLDNAGTKPANNYSWKLEGGGTIDVSQVLLNDGHGKFVDDTVNRITGEPGGDDNALKCADLNNDGHYDLVVATLTGRSEKLLINDGTGHFNFVPDGIPYAPGDSSLSLDISDLNGDKVLDLVTGQGETGTNFIDRVYLGSGANLVDTRPPQFRAIQTPAPLAETPTVIRFALRDSATNEQGQMVKSASVTYKITGGTTKTVKATFYGSDLFRGTIPAQPAGTEITVTLSATDRVGNVGTSAPFTFTVPTPITPGGSGGAGSGGAGGSGGSAGAPAGAGGMLGGAGGTAGGTVAGTGGSGEAGTPDVGDAGEPGIPEGGTSAGGGGGKSSGGKAGASVAGGAETGDAGETSVPGGAGKGSTSVSTDDGGCSIATPAPVTKGRGAALLGLGLAMLGLVRRRRNSKQ